MSTADIAARVQRLDEPSRGLALEISRVDKAEDPMLYLERQACLAGLRRTLAGVETARVVLGKLRQRIDRPFATC